jgi:hypothetical protein
MALPKRRTSETDPDRQAGAPGAEPDWHDLYEIENPVEVEAYVVEHPTVVTILDEAPDEIRAVFGNVGLPKLRLNWDPEEGDCWLFIGIPWTDLGPSVLPLIDAFDERWSPSSTTATDATVVVDVVSL